MQSIWDPRLIVPPNSPMMGDGCLKFPEFPLIDLDELDLRFIERTSMLRVSHLLQLQLQLQLQTIFRLRTPWGVFQKTLRRMFRLGANFPR